MSITYSQEKPPFLPDCEQTSILQRSPSQPRVVFFFMCLRDPIDIGYAIHVQHREFAMWAYRIVPEHHKLHSKDQVLSEAHDESELILALMEYRFIPHGEHGGIKFNGQAAARAIASHITGNSMTPDFHGLARLMNQADLIAHERQRDRDEAESVAVGAGKRVRKLAEDAGISLSDLNSLLDRAGKLKPSPLDEKFRVLLNSGPKIPDVASALEATLNGTDEYGFISSLDTISNRHTSPDLPLPSMDALLKTSMCWRTLIYESGCNPRKSKALFEFDLKHEGYEGGILELDGKAARIVETMTDLANKDVIIWITWM